LVGIDEEDGELEKLKFHEKLMTQRVLILQGVSSSSFTSHQVSIILNSLQIVCLLLK
jgi:hypothetical protein